VFLRYLWKAKLPTRLILARVVHGDYLLDAA
jgi:hypothetical protein